MTEERIKELVEDLLGPAGQDIICADEVEDLIRAVAAEVQKAGIEALRNALREIATKSPIQRSVIGEGMQISTTCGQCMDIIAIADKALATEAVRLSEIKEK